MRSLRSSADERRVASAAPPHELSSNPSHVRIVSFLAELKRRRVVRVAIVYGAVAFAVLQAADILVPALRLPRGTMTLLVLLLALGLPVALVLAWAFELTPAGVQRTAVTTDKPPAATAGSAERWVSARTIAVAALLLVLGAAAGWLIKPGGGASADDDRTITLAVLPFANVGDPQDLYFADGMSDALRGKLAALDGMVVIASSSARAYRDTEKSPREIGRELGVRYLLTGTVRWARSRDGTSRVQVNPELITAETGTTRWQEPFDAVLSDVFTVQGEIATRVADALSVRLLEPQREQLTARPTANLEAYDAYLRASQLLRQAESGAAVQRVAAEGFRRAVELDPTFALAWAQLAYAHMGAYWFYEDHSNERLRLARAAADTALALRPDLPEAHVADGHYWYWGFRAYERGISAFERASILGRNNSLAVAGLAAAQRRQGRWNEAAENFRRAAALDPLSAGLFRDLAVTLVVNGSLAAADSASARAIDLAPAQIGNYVMRAAALYAAERPVDAVAIMREAMRMKGPEAALTELASRQWNRWLPLADSVFWQPVEQLPLTSAVVDTGDFYLMRAEWLHAVGQHARAAAHADSAHPFLVARLRRTGDDWWDRGQVALALALSGDARGAQSGMGEAFAALQRAPDALDQPDVEFHAAKVALLSGDRARALSHLANAMRSGGRVSPAFVRNDLRFTPLRGDPRYEALVRPR
jgi:TolB-like protein